MEINALVILKSPCKSVPLSFTHCLRCNSMQGSSVDCRALPLCKYRSIHFRDLDVDNNGGWDGRPWDFPYSFLPPPHLPTSFYLLYSLSLSFPPPICWMTRKMFPKYTFDKLNVALRFPKFKAQRSTRRHKFTSNCEWKGSQPASKGNQKSHWALMWSPTLFGREIIF